MPPPPTASPFRDLVDESFDEAVFLWDRWEQELSSLTRNLDEVWSWTEDRLQGAIEGVRVAGPDLIELAARELTSDEPRRVAVGAGVLASSTDQAAIDAVAAALGTAHDDTLRALVRGLELLGSEEALARAVSTLVARGPEHAGTVCRLKAFHRLAPDKEMVTALKSDLPHVRADALAAAVHVTSAAIEDWIAAAWEHGEASVRAAAVRSGVGRGMGAALEAATRLAQRYDADTGPYLRILAMLGGADAHAVVYTALRIPALQPPAIWALGHIGTVRAVDICVAGTSHETLSRACGEAYCWITGADLERDHLAKKETPPEVPPFEDDNLDANLVPAPEELWPLPDADAVKAHWQARRAQFAADVRHIHGQPAGTDTVVAMVESGPMLRRPDLILELRARTRGRYDMEPRAFRARQRQMMQVGRAVLREGR